MSTQFFITAVAALLQATSVEPDSQSVSETLATTQSVETHAAAQTLDDLPEPQEIRQAQTLTQDVEALAHRAQSYLESVTTLKARFSQTGPNGQAMPGEIYIARPGRIRFAYDEPSPLLIVADGTTVAIADRELDTVDRAPIGSTPLRWLLAEETNLWERGAVVTAEYHENQLYITLEDPEGETEGRITFAFDDPNPQGPASAMTLTEWYAVDAVGGLTQMHLSEIVRGERLDPRLFILDDDQGDDRRRGRRR
ncbi:LolA family protein [Woodsholea maritima]|uniref:LolA family protein n=1 Tax=Woodsholea maritima TaxID=240237 RepID=UPI0003739489|nr:outer-membrane lipoprotein carrier protein LolA [Woodsholea maritima]